MQCHNISESNSRTRENTLIKQKEGKEGWKEGGTQNRGRRRGDNVEGFLLKGKGKK